MPVLIGTRWNQPRKANSGSDGLDIGSAHELCLLLKGEEGPRGLPGLVVS